MITAQDIAKLTKAQRDVLSQICMGNDGGHHPATLETLERKGFIESYKQTLGGRFPVIVTRYTYSIPVHMAWCEWAVENEKSKRAKKRAKVAKVKPTLFR